MRALLGASILLAVVGAIDAVRGDHWDQFVILVVIASACAGALALQRGGTRWVTPRPDLLEWAREQAAVTDDTVERIVDRALAAQRAQLHPEGSAPEVG